MYEDVTDRLRTYVWILVLLAAAIIVNVIAMTKPASAAGVKSHISASTEFSARKRVKVAKVKKAKKYRHQRIRQSAVPPVARAIVQDHGGGATAAPVYSTELYPGPGRYVPRVRHATVHRGPSTVIGGRPAGCPWRFCGCALSIRLFGRQVPGLNLAWNWAVKFPRTSPAPGMVAVRRGHVFQLLAHAGGNHWVAWDANSGGHRIRIHNRSVAGHVIVNPHGTRLAMAQ